MGHHFDSPESRADSRINITDNFVFHGEAPGSVAVIMCVSPLAGLTSPFTGTAQWRTFRPGCAYDFRFDTDGDARVDRIARFVFEGDVAPQAWTLSVLEGEAARDHHGTGQVIGRGTVGEAAHIDGFGKVWIDEAGDPFWLDAVAAKTFIDSLLAGGTWQPDTFSTGSPTTGATNVIGIVLELLPQWIGDKPFNLYTTVSANDHGHWSQVQRCGRPNLAATFLDDPKNSLLYNSSDPDADRVQFRPAVVSMTARLVAKAGTHAQPERYGELVADLLLPDVIPFNPQRATSFGFAGVNGRGLRDDFGAVVYSAVFNHPMRTALAPLADTRDSFPYLAPARPLPDPSAGAGPAVPKRNAV
jgi:Domain of unknown function (DUF4331)